MQNMNAFSLALMISTVCISNWANAQLSGLFGPGNYDECILENMKSVSSDIAARAVMSSCRRAFPTKPFTDTSNPIDVRGTTCVFVFDSKALTFARLNSDEEERLDKSLFEYTTFIRDGFGLAERETAAEALVEADRLNLPSLPLRKELYRSLSKEVYFPKGLTREFMQTQERKVPICS